MRVYVHDFSDDTEKVFEGEPEAVQAQLFERYPWLRPRDVSDGCDLEDTLEYLDATAYFQVHVEDDSLAASTPDVDP